MKDAFIIFQNTLPSNKKETLNLIQHFCREHGLSFTVPDGFGEMVVTIDKEAYDIKIQEETDESGTSSWTIYCLLRRHPAKTKHLLFV